MVREISKGKYLIAGIITFLIFSLGISLGVVFDFERIKWVEQTGKEQDVNYRSLQLQYLIVDTFVTDMNSSCNVLKATLDKSIKDLDYSLRKLEQFSDETLANEEDYILLQRRYLIDNINYWIFAKKAKESCSFNIVPLLYFFSDKKCPNCGEMGVMLTYYKNKFGDSFLVFPLNMDLEENESLLTLLAELHGLDESHAKPTLILGDEKVEGLLQLDELGEKICKDFIKKPEECE